MPRLRHHCMAAVLMCAAAGCATRSANVAPQPDDPARFAGWDCERLFDEADRVQSRAAEVAYAVDERVGSNIVALGIGVTVFWPALLAMRADGPAAKELAALKGSHEALQQAAQRRGCPPPPAAMSAARAAMLPLRAGERFVYEQRAGRGAAPQELGLRVTALLRDRIEFAPDLAGRPLPGPWSQDLAGNVRPDSRAPLMSWRHLIEHDLQLGQVLVGDLYAADRGVDAPVRVRGQVVAQGVQVIAGRTFDVAVLELFGDAPSDEGGFVRLSGVMAVDRASGLLLRLDLSCANPAFAMRRRLMRVEPAAG
ncbi:MAG: hypothetical protein LKCHEGNO_02902 [Burkholderiaceae bacterium]|nr:hypothetical protein [Burkholderiaceae bacterium]